MGIQEESVFDNDETISEVFVNISCVEEEEEELEFIMFIKYSIFDFWESMLIYVYL